MDRTKTRTSSWETLSSCRTAPLKPKPGLNGPPADGGHDRPNDCDADLSPVEKVSGNYVEAKLCWRSNAGRSWASYALFIHVLGGIELNVDSCIVEPSL